MNAEWALQQVDELMGLLEQSYAAWTYGRHDQSAEDAIEARHPVYRRIRGQVTSEAAGYAIGGGSSFYWRWSGLRG